MQPRWVGLTAGGESREGGIYLSRSSHAHQSFCGNAHLLSRYPHVQSLAYLLVSATISLGASMKQASNEESELNPETAFTLLAISCHINITLHRTV
jgi:hypothetical protein